MNSIYMYKNKINGHMYIGLASNPQRRYSEHKNAALNPNSDEYDYPIHAAIRKYGLENFDFIILEDNLSSVEKMKEREQYWIKYYNTYEDRAHYNQTPGGDCVGEKSIHRGEEHGMAKLTEKDVIFCRECYQKGLRSRDIWNKYFSEKITYVGFLRMWHGKTWKHIKPEVFNFNPHRGNYTAADRDIITALYRQSGLTLNQFQKTKECYVGYGTLYKMVHDPSFYDNK